MVEPFDNPQTWGASIREAREEARMNQNVLAEELGTTRQRLGRIEDGHEGKTPRRPHERRAISIAVAEFTGHRDVLGLSEPEPTEVDRLRTEFDRKLVEQKNELRAEAEKELIALEAQLSSQGIAVPRPR